MFDGLNDQAVVQVVFVEVTTGSSALNARERQVRDSVKAGRVRWEELRVPSELATQVNSDMKTNSRVSPEQRELEAKRAELVGLETELSQRELKLATLQTELRAFEARYLRIVGGRFAQRDELEAAIVEVVARQPRGKGPIRHIIISYLPW